MTFNIFKTFLSKIILTREVMAQPMHQNADDRHCEQPAKSKASNIHLQIQDDMSCILVVPPPQHTCLQPVIEMRRCSQTDQSIFISVKK